MLEKQRLVYLENLGIDNYMPRRQLPGAASSPLLPDALLQEPTAFSTADAPLENETAQPPVVTAFNDTDVDIQGDTIDRTHTEPAEIAPTIRRDTPSSDLTALLTADNVNPESNNNKLQSSPEVGGSDDHVPSEKTVSEQLAIRFTLTSWRIGDLLVMDSRESGSALPTDRLLQNILRSIGYKVAQLPTSEILRWPLFASNQFTANSVEQEKTEAVAMIQAYIAAQCQKSSTRAVILMGENACSFALAPQESHDDFFTHRQGVVQAHEQWQLPVVVTPSLNDMLLEPTKKRITWQALQALLAL